ncbi:MAG TPA: DMT family transporter [Methylibium sp.]|uniref:DMT family transporter n=1 Tax=Methylibium sp. TaxID=2067992 RepID=UPI002DBF3589|nr:DMT family transporter [Methylibium sp.]HEU4458360.1 DMT family transporter [Methylibium sp.]
MPGETTRLDALAIVCLVGCCALWGLNQVSIKAALPEVPAFVQLSIRSVVACVLLLGWMRWRGIGLPLRDGTLAPGLLAGLLFAVEFGLIFFGLQYTTAARSVVFINTSPFVVAAVLAAVLPAERLKPLQALGLVVAFAGVAYAFVEPPAQAAQASRWPWLGDALIVLAAALWGATTITIRLSVLRRAPAETTLAYQLIVASLLSPLAAWATDSTWPASWSALAIGSLAYQAVIVTFASYLLWFWLLTRYPATKVQGFVVLTPVFGTAFAAVLLGESLGPKLLVGLGAIVVGLTLLNRRT